MRSKTDTYRRQVELITQQQGIGTYLKPIEPLRGQIQADLCLGGNRIVGVAGIVDTASHQFTRSTGQPGDWRSEWNLIQITQIVVQQKALVSG